jgi:RimJ/RimL family protein N-acetyltransferase
VDSENIIRSQRLELIPMAADCLQACLARDRERASAIAGFIIPDEWLGDSPYLSLRIGQLRDNPALEPWLVRAMILRDSRQVVGQIGFHTGPDPDYLRELAPGGVEFGVSVLPAFRQRGLAGEACAALIEWARRRHRVTRFVMSIRPDNEPSLRIAHRLGFEKIGAHVDPIDGHEDIYRLDIDRDRATGAARDCP